MGTATTKRAVYYSPVDHRLHMKGATEGWTRIGAIGKGTPVRVDRVTGVKNVDFGDNWDAMRKFFTEKALPESLKMNQAVIDAIAKWGPDYATAVRANYQEALKRDLCPSERRYILDLVRDDAYRCWRDRILLETQKKYDVESRPVHGYNKWNQATVDAWTVQRTLSQIDVLYGEGKFDKVATGIAELAAQK